ncbi:putative mitochondrial protein [Apostasia shenzhenica]|uniref:Putative mitochondrial protein n=1 Tax=Apostasia shenzhenica TaxID=1088818 RepID=A0A2I0B1M6_9ASPA|nr:putative mitochondrial protein [Apostasia shenzhenica]
MRSWKESSAISVGNLNPQQALGVACNSHQSLLGRSAHSYFLPTRLAKVELPKFSGQDVRGWVFRCEHFFEIDNTPPEFRLKLISIYLEGKALHWHQNFLRSRGNAVSWEEYKVAISQRFAERAYEDPLSDLITLKQDGTVNEYLDKFDEISSKLNLNDEQIVSFFVTGLKEEIQYGVRLLRPHNLREAANLASIQELALGAVNRRVKDERRAKGLCYKCDEKYSFGHKCKNQLYLIQSNEEEADELEDISEDLVVPEVVPEKEEVEEGPQISLQALTGLPSFNTMVVEGMIKKKSVFILVDSGSTHNFVDPELAKATQCELEEIANFQVNLATGARYEVTQLAKEVVWKVQGHIFKADMMILPLGSYDVVLGVQWLATLGPVSWDFLKLQMSFQYLGQHVVLKGVRKQYVRITNGRKVSKVMQNSSMVLHVQLQSITTEQKLSTEGTCTQAKIIELVDKFKDIFTESSGLPPFRSHDHQITLKSGAEPVTVRPYRYPFLQKTKIERLIAEMMAAGIIRNSTSPFSSPVVLVKKRDGTWRLCVDYRELNDKIVKVKFPIPIIEELLDELHGSIFFSKLDLRTGYWQIRMKEEDIYKTAFRTHQGHYEFLVMPFGLTNAPSTFQSLMNEVFQPYLRKFILVFFYDILVYSADWISHLHHLETVFLLLRTHHLNVKRSKCLFGVNKVNYLGHIISAEGVEADPEKLEAMKLWPLPKSVKELRGFLGLTGYYRRFIQNYGQKAKPLTALLKLNGFQWSEEANAAFEQLKMAVTSPPVLALPNFSKEFLLETDASGNGIGAVLMQEGRPIAYFSKALSGKNLLLSIYEKEMLAIVAAIQKWRHYLVGVHFKIRTDQESLKYLMEQRISTPAQQKWIARLIGYDYEITFKRGVDNKVADALSRRTFSSAAIQGHIVQGISTNLMQRIQQSWQTDSKLQQLISDLQINPVLPYSWKNQQLRRKGKLVVGSDSELRFHIVQMMHADATGGHSGAYATMKRIKTVFHWRGINKLVRAMIKQCEVCQRSKYDASAYPGFLQPLPIPNKAWSDISMDFIEGLPPSNGRNIILVVVDRLTKYAHFIALSHPYSALEVAQIFLDNVFKLHGMPTTIVSDRDPVFISKFWKDFLRLQGVAQHMSTAYHPQTDGQTEVVNRCLETYLRCMTHERPKQWVRWLPLAEWWYNTNYHSSIRMSPYEALYGQSAPLSVPYTTGESEVDAVDRSLSAHETARIMLKKNLEIAQNRMRQLANRKRSECTLEVTDWVYVKLKPYRQDSIAHRVSHKLSPRYFSPFQVIEKIGSVAYKLKLPEGSKIHAVFHISMLKKHVGNHPAEGSFPSMLNDHGQVVLEPIAILDRRLIKKKNRIQVQLLIQWSNASKEDATWMNVEVMRQNFPQFNLNP